MMKLAAALFAALTLSGCVISMNVPISRLESPEADGGFPHGEAGLGLVGSSNVDVVSSTTSTPPAQNNLKIAHGSNTHLFAGVGTIDRLNLSLQVALFGGLTGYSVPLFRLKYQWLGETHVKPSAGSFSLATTFAGGVTKYSQKDTILFSGGDFADSEVRMWALDAAAILGYRMSGIALLYGGPFFARHAADITVAQSIGGAITSYPFATTANVSGANLGVQLDPRPFTLRAEGALASLKANALSSTHAYLGIFLGLHW